jgi:polar amino acid transport system substrate-binding protein
MRRLSIAVIVVVAAAAALATWSGAAPRGDAARGGPAAKLPPLPADVAKRKRWVIGVKCDFPPFGFIDVRGQNAGYDVEVAHWFARYAFGRAQRIRFVCVTTPSRIPALQAKRVDIIVSTLTYTPQRAETIDFSIPYYAATGRLLVPNDSSVRSLADLKGKTVVSTRGSIYDRWVTKCFTDSKLLLTDTTSAALLALKDGRADTFMFDDALLLGLATQDRDLKLTSDKFLAIPWGIGIRKGETAMKQWVDSRLRLMQKKDTFWKILQNNAPKRLAADFKDNVPRPNSKLQYPPGDPASVCS